MAKYSTFSDEIRKQIELGNLETAQKLACKEIIELWQMEQRRKIETSKKWLR